MCDIRQRSAAGIRMTVALCALILGFSGTTTLGKTLSVTSIGDAGGACLAANCTLRQALAAALVDDTINFSLPANSTIALTSGQLSITKNVTISGPGARTLTISGNNASRIFSNPAGVTTTISELTIANAATGTASGGAIENFGTLTLLNCAVLNNSGGSGAGVVNGGGKLTVVNCTFAGNRSTGHGAALRNTGTMIISNSTFNDNAGVFSGAITSFASAAPAATVTITSCTISGNRATDTNGGIGGGVFNGDLSTTTLRNTIVANNTAVTGKDLSGSFTSQGFNLVRDGAGPTITTAPGATGDQIGTPAAANPMLGALQNNGGPTDTQALLSGSPAIDKGHSSGAEVDQRNFTRRVDSLTFQNATGGDGTDIGAYEVQANTLAGCNGGVYEVVNNADSGPGSLRAVTGEACGGSTVNFAADVRGAITLTTAELLMNQSLTIIGPGANLLSVERSKADGTPEFRILNNPPGVQTSISGLRLAGGYVPAGFMAFYSAGGIANSGKLILANTTIADHLSSDAGGGIFNFNGTLIVTNSTISGSFASRGGGIYNFNGTATLTNSTISGNRSGGGIVNASGTLALTNCTVSNNTGVGIERAGGTVSARNTIIAKNPSSTSTDIYGELNSEGFNLIGNIGNAMISPTTGDQIGTPGSTIDPMLDSLGTNGGPTRTQALLPGSRAIDKGHSSGSSTDQRGFARPIGTAAVNGSDGSDIGAFELGPPTPLVGNVATRLPVGIGVDALFEGFTVDGPPGSTKQIIVRAIGPALIPFGIADALVNPTLEIHDSTTATIAVNDDWKVTQLGGLITGNQGTAISASGFAPSNDAESAIIADLVPGSYTAVVRGAGDATGTGVVDAYDLSASSVAKLTNVATRGLIQPGNKLMIAGLTIQNGPVRLVVRAIGPSLLAFGINNALPDTTLELRDANAAIVRENDNWRTDQQQELIDTGLQPSDDLEAALVATIPPGQYTAQVRGKPEGTGTGVVQVYFLQ